MQSNFWRNLLINNLVLIGILITWLIYRFGVFSTRKGVIKSLINEIHPDISSPMGHDAWMANQYHDQIISDPSWNIPGYVVFKLSTVALDSAIEKGSAYFLNPKLIEKLTRYRQAVNQFNQLIDAAQDFQSNDKLWDKTNKDILKRMNNLIYQIHWYGIGDDSKLLGHAAYKALDSELQKEKDSKLLPIVWLLTGVNLFPIKMWICMHL